MECWIDSNWGSSKRKDWKLNESGMGACPKGGILYRNERMQDLKREKTRFSNYKGRGKKVST